MKRHTIGKMSLSPVSFGSSCSYEIRGDCIIGRFLGFLPMRRVHLEDVRYLRLATQDELSPLYIVFNWKHLFSRQRLICPIYVLQTNTRQRLLLKLKGDKHFKLRQVLGRRSNRQGRAVAA